MTEDHRLQIALDVLHAGIRTLREDDAQFVADISLSLPEAAADVERAIVGLARAAKHAEAMSKACKTLAAETKARAARLEDRAERLRGLIFGAMQTLNRQRIEAPDLTLSVGMSGRAVIVTDESLVPDDYVKMERTISKSALAEDLKAGVIIPGVELGNGSPSLTIRSS